MPFNLKTALAILLTALGAGALVSYLLLSNPAITLRINNFFYDLWLLTMEKREPNPLPAIIEIDEKSMRKIGQLPWSRTVLADLVTTLLYDGVAAIGLDIWLTEPDRSSPVAVDSELERNFGINLNLANIPQPALDNDRYLRDQIMGKAVVIGAFADLEKEGQLPENMPPSLHLDGEDDSGASKRYQSIREISGLLPPLPILTDAAPVGFLNVILDEDGLIRKMPFLQRSGEKIYPGMALRTLMTALGEKSIALEATDSVLQGARLGKYEIALEKDGSFRPIYRGPARSFPYYSAIDVLEGKVGRKELEGKILFIGPTTHSINNIQSTPFDPAMPEMEIHATIVDNILSGISVKVPDYAKKILLAAIFVSAFLGSAAFFLLSLPVYIFLTLLACTSYIWASWLAFQKGLFLSPAGPVFAMLLCGLVILPFRYWHEQAQKRKLKRAFNQYVSPEIVNKIVSEGEQLLRGEQKDATILFTDVRGFTSISENLAPTQLVRLLNCYFTPMTACVIAHQGTLDKFIGDALMAFWNAPINVENHSLKAVLAALDMQKALECLRPRLMAEFGINMRMGIGIHCGTVHVGNMGSTDLMDYTCIGDTVNLASRLESMCKRYGADIVVSARVRAACGLELRQLLLDRISVKGRNEPLEIYMPLKPDEELPENVERLWLEALEAYFGGNFKYALTIYKNLDEIELLKTAAQLFMERCQNLIAKRPEMWDGVWRYNDK